MVTEEILKSLDNGTAPWDKPWRVDLHQNLANKYTYRGINQLLCELYMMKNPEWTHGYWLTYKGAKAKGGNVRKGEKSQFVIFWKWIEKLAEDEEGHEYDESFPILRYYRVFNVAQCEGIEIPETNGIEYDPNEKAEELINNYPGPAPSIEYGGNSAYYMPPKDHVQIPKAEKFVDMNAYYATIFHELTHSTGHENRLNREEIKNVDAMRGESYSKEELVAELGSAMLSAVTGIDPSTRERAASYINHWRQKLTEDNKLIVMAASRAGKAADYIQNKLDSEQDS
jgi:antirestriction protein ArdC